MIFGFCWVLVDMVGLGCDLVLGLGCGRWWLVAVVVGFVFAVVFLWWVSNGGCWLEFVIGDFLFCL